MTECNVPIRRLKKEDTIAHELSDVLGRGASHDEVVGILESYRLRYGDYTLYMEHDYDIAEVGISYVCEETDDEVKVRLKRQIAGRKAAVTRKKRKEEKEKMEYEELKQKFGQLKEKYEGNDREPRKG